MERFQVLVGGRFGESLLQGLKPAFILRCLRHE